jgi:uncharacterized protein
MIRLTELKLALDHTPADLQALIHSRLGVTPIDVIHWTLFKRSYDARKADLLVVYIVDVELTSPVLEAAALARHAHNAQVFATPDMAYQAPTQASAHMPLRPVVVGFGPCGMFAALMLAQMGFKPIVLERGKTVRERTKDTWGLWRKNQLHPESNVQFGEGGAGTFSDGKLWSQIKDPRHLGRKVMQEFVKAGAPADILIESHPHIGTFKLVKVVENMRAQIIALGGEIRFEHRVTDLKLESLQSSKAKPTDGKTLQVRGLTVWDAKLQKSYNLDSKQVIICVGHSARDTFSMLYERGVFMQAKPFSIGFRIEHPQGLIDRARWGRHAGHPLLGAAEYKLVHHASNGRSVYSFCMCPGGTVVAATSEPGRVVTNGMSQYSRNERNANAGIVVGIDPADYPTDPPAFQATLGGTFGADGRPKDLPHPLAGIVMQRQLESNAYLLGGSTYEAPAQLVGDFLVNSDSTILGSVVPSYKPGVHLGNLATALPAYAIDAIREAIPAFAKKIKGFDMADAVLTGVETRTSSPLKITRGDDFQSLNVAGLYPAGEGASYAGGILSAGVDGIRVAEAVARDFLS